MIFRQLVKQFLTMECILNPRSTGAACTGMTNIASANSNVVGTDPAVQSQLNKAQISKGQNVLDLFVVYDVNVVSLAVNSIRIFC